MERASKINDKFGMIYNTWSATLFYMGKYEEALEKAKKAEKLNCPVPNKFLRLIKRKIKNK